MGRQAKTSKMLPEWLNVGKPHYAEEGGPENCRNTSKSVSRLETQLESAPGSPSSRTALRPSLQRSFHPTTSFFGLFFWQSSHHSKQCRFSNYVDFKIRSLPCALCPARLPPASAVPRGGPPAAQRGTPSRHVTGQGTG